MWIPDDARKLYGLDRWGADFFDLDKNGEVIVRLRENGEAPVAVSLPHIIREMKARGREMPLILRFRNLLDRRIEHLNESFLNAIQAADYKGTYRGVYPVKVNQQQQVIDEITQFGKRYHFGLEVGSKPELLAALGYLHDTEALLICNGYKDHEFIDLALRASKLGLRVVIVLEMPGELPDVLARAKELEIKPELGLRFRLSTKSEGHWAESGGDRSTFGLNTSQVIDTVDLLKKEGYLDCLRLFHYHQGSQLPNIRAIREAASEAVRVYTNLMQEGAPMGLLDMGGGLAIDYDGTQANTSSSCNYTLEEYAADLVEIVQQACDGAGVPHPDLITESGRAVVAYYSVLVFNILDVSRFEEPKEPKPPEEDAHEALLNLWGIRNSLDEKHLQESFNDALYYRDQIRALFTHGVIDLRTRASAERIYWHVLTRIAHFVRDLKQVPEDLQNLDQNLIDIYYGNFSVFQSLPDNWAIGQLFPVMPLHRHDEEPNRQAVLSDITCDCDGKIDRFISDDQVKNHLPVHHHKSGEDYYLGAFLVGAYQETLGDLHNLLGDPNVVSVGIKDGEVTFTHEVEGDSVADVLSYVEYDPKNLEAQFREFAESAVKTGRITPEERRIYMQAFRESLHGYTYYE